MVGDPQYYNRAFDYNKHEHASEVSNAMFCPTLDQNSVTYIDAIDVAAERFLMGIPGSTSHVYICCDHVVEEQRRGSDITLLIPSITYLQSTTARPYFEDARGRRWKVATHPYVP